MREQAHGSALQKALELSREAALYAVKTASEHLLSARPEELVRAMEPLDKALKLNRELQRDCRESAQTTLIVETLVPAPAAAKAED